MVRETLSRDPDWKPTLQRCKAGWQGWNRALIGGKGLDRRAHYACQHTLMPDWGLGTVLEPMPRWNAGRQHSPHLHRCRVRDRWPGRYSRSRPRMAPRRAGRQTPSVAHSVHSIIEIVCDRSDTRLVRRPGQHLRQLSATSKQSHLEDHRQHRRHARCEAAIACGQAPRGALRRSTPALCCNSCTRRCHAGCDCGRQGVPHCLPSLFAGYFVQLRHGQRHGASDQLLQGPA